MSDNHTNVKLFLEPRIEFWIVSNIYLDYIKRYLLNEANFNIHMRQELSKRWHMCIMEGTVLLLLHSLGMLIPYKLIILLVKLGSVLRILSKSIVYHEHVPMIDLIDKNESVQNNLDAWLKSLGSNVDREALTALEVELLRLRFGTSSDDQRAKYSFFIELLPQRKPLRGTDTVISIREAKMDQVEQQPPHESRAPAESTREHLLDLWLTIIDIRMHKDNGIARINLHCEKVCRDLSSNVSDLFESGSLVNPRIQPLTFHDINKWLTDGHCKMNRIADYYIGMVTKEADDTIAVLRDVERLLNENPSSHIMRVGTVNCFDRKVQHMHRDMEKAMDRVRREAAASRIL
ncbi:uncharacterized protein LOC128203598 [Mya arenaria]|uniref:uncharacterized protein LOC128203598 n=1 Tax=Mya arenaria TaxID=6604 RepID=UPI0022E503EB|nr:uncharacterized protein LOC128203598 [Mya arenaria]